MDQPKPSWHVRLLRSESSRSSVAAVLSIVIATPVVTMWMIQQPLLRPYAWAIGCLMGWAVFAALHALMTVASWHQTPMATGADRPVEPVRTSVEESGTASARVAEAVGEQIREGRRRWRRWSDRQNQAPSWSVQVSALALLVVAVILVTPALRSTQSVLFAALAMVAACWVNVVVMYAVHYARLSAKDDGLAFPGEPPGGLADYLYFALAVQSTFGTTDVEIRTRVMRRVVAGHGALAFVFNSVIIAMIVSLLLGVAV